MEASASPGMPQHRIQRRSALRLSPGLWDIHFEVTSDWMWIRQRYCVLRLPLTCSRYHLIILYMMLFAFNACHQLTQHTQAGKCCLLEKVESWVSLNVI